MLIEHRTWQGEHGQWAVCIEEVQTMTMYVQTMPMWHHHYITKLTRPSRFSIGKKIIVCECLRVSGKVWVRGYSCTQQQLTLSQTALSTTHFLQTFYSVIILCNIDGERIFDVVYVTAIHVIARYFPILYTYCHPVKNWIRCFFWNSYVPAVLGGLNSSKLTERRTLSLPYLAQDDLNQWLTQ